MAKPLITVSYSQFFDRKTVIDAVEKAERKQLSKAGSFVRTSARGSIRIAGKKGASSKPGKPPKTPRNTPRRYKDTIFFGYDRKLGSVVIGPSSRFGDGRIPGILEFGGRQKIDGKSTRYEPRPHMQPALIREAPKFPGLFKNAVR